MVLLGVYIERFLLQNFRGCCRSRTLDHWDTLKYSIVLNHLQKKSCKLGYNDRRKYGNSVDGEKRIKIELMRSRSPMWLLKHEHLNNVKDVNGGRV